MVIRDNKWEKHPVCRHAIVLVLAIATAIAGVLQHRGAAAAVLSRINYFGSSARTANAVVVVEVDDRPFPRWDEERGIDFPVLLEYIEARKKNVHLYVVDRRGLRASRAMRNRTSQGLINQRLVRTEPALVYAVRMLLDHLHSTSTRHTNETAGAAATPRWPHLRRALESGDGGVPFAARFEDWKWCVHREGRGRPVPVFTTAAPVTPCSYSFPMPTYKTVADSQPGAAEWEGLMAAWKERYAVKIPKAVWRGSFGGAGNPAGTGWRQHQRWRLVTETQLATNATVAQNYDVGFTGLPPAFRNVTEVVDTMADGAIKPMADFQKYAAIIDTDGYSWSSRFGTLLCYNSVTVKVEPRYVDYFYFKRTPTDPPLAPGVQYVPVKYDLSDLHEKVAWVLDPVNAPAVQKIVRKANAWCLQQMTMPAVAADLLDMWEFYVRMLDTGDPQWQTRAEERLFSNAEYDFFDLYTHA